MINLQRSEINSIRRGGGFYLTAAFLVLLLFLIPAECFGLSITLEESPDPPKGVEIVPEDELNQLEPVAAPDAAPASTSAPAASTGAAAPSQAAPDDKSRYKGPYKLWRPLRKVFPLDAATVTGIGINLMEDKNWIVYSSRYTGFMNYYLQGGDDLWFFDNFKGMFNYTRQAKNQLTSNTVYDLAGAITKLNLNVKYNRNFKSTSGGSTGASSVNKTDARRFVVSFNPNQKINLEYAADRSITQTVNSGVSSKTENRKDAWTFSSKPTNKTTLSAIHQYTTNWNRYSLSATKTTQTDWRLIYNITQKIAMDFGYQFIGNRAITGTSPESETRKTTRIAGLSYQLTPDLRIRYAYNFANNRNEANLSVANASTTSRETEIQYAILSWLNFSGKNQISYSQNAGKTAQRQATFNLDHSKRKLFPGVSVIQFNKNVKAAISPVDPRQNVTHTMMMNTPLSYFDGRLSLNRQYTLNEQRDSQQTTETKQASVARNYSAAYKVTKSFTVSDSLNITSSDNEQNSGTSSLSENKTSNFQANLMVKHPFTRGFKLSKSLVYTFTRGRTLNRAFIPNPTMTDNAITKHTGKFLFQGQTWNMDYTLERNISKVLNGVMGRSIVHKANWNVNNIRGYNMTGNYTVSLQRGGSTSGGVFTLSKSKGKINQTFTYEFSKNKVLGNRQQNTFVRYFEMGLKYDF